MSLPVRTLAMNCKNEDFPTPGSPTRRMVYGLFLDVLTIPFLRDLTSLGIPLTSSMGLLEAVVSESRVNASNETLTA